MMKLTAGICDDCAEHAALLEKYIRDYQSADSLRIVQSTNPLHFLDLVRNENPHFVLLDIDMNGMNGIELGERIKELNSNTIIIYVTAHEKYALEAFRVRAFHYLVKPITKDKVSAALTETLAFIKHNRRPEAEKMFVVQRKGDTVSLSMDHICYFEKTGHKIRVISVNGCEEYYGNFTKLIEQIGTDDFIRCHQGFIVNVAKIRALRDKTLFLCEGLHVPVSRTFMENVRKSLANRLFAGKGGV